MGSSETSGLGCLPLLATPENQDGAAEAEEAQGAKSDRKTFGELWNRLPVDRHHGA